MDIHQFLKPRLNIVDQIKTESIEDLKQIAVMITDAIDGAKGYEKDSRYQTLQKTLQSVESAITKLEEIQSMKRASKRTIRAMKVVTYNLPNNVVLLIARECVDDNGEWAVDQVKITESYTIETSDGVNMKVDGSKLGLEDTFDTSEESVEDFVASYEDPDGVLVGVADAIEEFIGEPADITSGTINVDPV